MNGVDISGAASRFEAGGTPPRRTKTPREDRYPSPRTPSSAKTQRKRRTTRNEAEPRANSRPPRTPPRRSRGTERGRSRGTERGRSRGTEPRVSSAPNRVLARRGGVHQRFQQTRIDESRQSAAHRRPSSTISTPRPRSVASPTRTSPSRPRPRIPPRRFRRIPPRRSSRRLRLRGRRRRRAGNFSDGVGGGFPNVVAARHRPFAHRSFAIPAGAASARFARIHPASRAVPNSRSDVHSEIFKSAGDSAAPRRLHRRARRPHARRREHTRKQSIVDARVRIRARRHHARAHRSHEADRRRGFESARSFARRRDRRACSPRTRRRSRVSPTRGAIATRRRERISPRASLARASPPRPASRRPRATPRDRRREAPRGSSPPNASSLVARSTAWRAVSANAASRRARSRARAVSVASAPTRITAKERARVG